MTEIQANELIAKFLNFTQKSYTSESEKMWCDEKNGLPVGELKFNSDWDWLMPACRRWDELKVKSELEPEYCRLSQELDAAVTLYEIAPIFYQLVKNIEWLNLQEK